MTDNPLYHKLKRLIEERLEEVRLASSDSSWVPPRERHRTTTEEILDAIWPEIEAANLAAEIVASEHFMWLMAGSDHTEAHLAALRKFVNEHRKTLRMYGDD